MRRRPGVRGGDRRTRGVSPPNAAASADNALDVCRFPMHFCRRGVVVPCPSLLPRSGRHGGEALRPLVARVAHILAHREGGHRFCRERTQETQQIVGPCPNVKPLAVVCRVEDHGHPVVVNGAHNAVGRRLDDGTASGYRGPTGMLPSTTSFRHTPVSVATMIFETVFRVLSVLYRALIAFWGECCRIVIPLQLVCYTENLAKGISALELPAQDFYPAPRSQIFYRTPPLPRLCPTPVKSPFSWRLRVPQERWFYRSADEWNAIGRVRR
jgi:hypothetical protein